MIYLMYKSAKFGLVLTFTYLQIYTYIYIYADFASGPGGGGLYVELHLVLVMDYHPNLKDLPKLIMNHLPTLYESPRMRKLFSDDKVQIRTGFHRTKNLKDLLVPSSLPDTEQENCTDSDNIGCYRCHRRVCDACQHFLAPAKRIKSVVTRKTYKIKQSLSCRTDYVIYCATCTLCNRQCVGSCINFTLVKPQKSR